MLKTNNVTVLPQEYAKAFVKSRRHMNCPCLSRNI
uniref:Uncharacterized protein n=1 Tax=Anguilla anguilla TaxID=7936 RepID=A0A0E9Y0I4_ANGAN